jgi:hypothetical protein
MTATGRPVEELTNGKIIGGFVVQMPRQKDCNAVSVLGSGFPG